MEQKIFKYQRKYDTQDEIVREGSIQYLDERTLHNIIKSMLINTTKDCIKCETNMDPYISKLSALCAKKDMTPEDIAEYKKLQNELRYWTHLAEIAENSLYNLVYEMLFSDEIKNAFKQEIPAMREDLYYMIDVEDRIAENVAYQLSEQYECPSYKSLCDIINGVINEFVDNVEEYVDDIEKHNLYKEFVEQRSESRSNDVGKENANE